jgi:membrane-bound serine protease (ClpP class)
VGKAHREPPGTELPSCQPVSVLLVLAFLAFLVLPAPWGLLAIAAAIALEVLEFMLWKRFLRRYRLRVGPEMLMGTSATVVTTGAPDGRVRVRVRGELWNAHSSGTVGVGEKVRIVAVDGLTLEVEPDR